jgi:hypothetical protein
MPEIMVDARLLWSELSYVEKLARINKEEDELCRCVLCEVQNGTLRLTTVGLDGVAWSAIPVLSSGEILCSFAVDAKLLLLAAGADSQILTLAIEEKAVTVMSGTKRWVLPNRAEASYAIVKCTGIRDLKGDEFQVAASQLKQALTTAVRFTSKRNLCIYDLRAVFVEIGSGFVNSAAASSHSAFDNTLNRLTNPTGEHIAVGILRHHINVITDITPIPTDIVTIMQANDLVRCECPPRGFGFAPALGGIPPIYKAMQASQTAAVIEVNVKDLRDSLRHLRALRAGAVRAIDLAATSPTTLTISPILLDGDVHVEDTLTVQASREVTFAMDSESALTFLRLVSGRLILQVDEKTLTCPQRIVFTASSGMRYVTTGMTSGAVQGEPAPGSESEAVGEKLTAADTGNAAVEPYNADFSNPQGA